MRFIVWLALLIAAPIAHAADLDERCARHLTYGEPKVSSATITVVCKDGYAAAHDDDKLIPRWVAYRLNGEQTLGCEKRKNNFHAEEELPAERRAKPTDYAKSGYDKGHMAPAADFAHSKTQISDSFSMVNMAPQLPGLNRKQWERLEETTRAWAWERGDLQIYVGPLVHDGAKTIGKSKVAVPTAFYKVIVDTASDESLAFLMPQKDIPKGKLDPWVMTVAEIEASAGVWLPMPDTADREVLAPLWDADVKGWNAKRSATCKGK